MHYNLWTLKISAKELVNHISLLWNWYQPLIAAFQNHDCPPVSKGWDEAGGREESMCWSCSFGCFVHPRTALSCCQEWARGGKQSQRGGDGKKRRSNHLTSSRCVNQGKGDISWLKDIFAQSSVPSGSLQAVRLRWQRNAAEEPDFLREDLKELLQGKYSYCPLSEHSAL